MTAGFLHGVDRGDHFSVYSNSMAFASGGDVLGEVVVDAVGTFSSFASPIGRFAGSFPDSGAIAVHGKLGAHGTPVE